MVAVRGMGIYGSTERYEDTLRYLSFSGTARPPLDSWGLSISRPILSPARGGGDEGGGYVQKEEG